MYVKSFNNVFNTDFKRSLPFVKSEAYLLLSMTSILNTYFNAGDCQDTIYLLTCICIPIFSEELHMTTHQHTKDSKPSEDLYTCSSENIG